MTSSTETPPTTAITQEVNRQILHSSATMNGKPVVIGIYGLPGCGKTHLMKQLRKELGEEDFRFYDGSEVIDSVVPGRLEAFKRMDEKEKFRWRGLAIDMVHNSCLASGKAAVVTGHFMFWEEGEEGEVVCTPHDLRTYTHILYLNTAPPTIQQYRHNDTERDRPHVSMDHLEKWRNVERSQLKGLCQTHGILFSLLRPLLIPVQISTLLRDFRLHNEALNLSRAERRLDEIFDIRRDDLETTLVMDADKTLVSDDTGSLFWEVFRDYTGAERHLREIFDSPLGYSYTTFRQATLLYEEIGATVFDEICDQVASKVIMRPEFVALLQSVAETKHIGAVVVTCGVRRVWEKILDREGLSGTVKVIGGGRISDGFVVTPSIKGALVTRLRNVYGTYVWAFGDSPLDIDMLSRANEAVVVVGPEETRSRSMDSVLLNAIDNEGFRARQVVLPDNIMPRLDTTKLPLVKLTGPEFVDSLLFRPGQLRHATKSNAAKLLMTPMRDAGLAGPLLRRAHGQVGRYLATEFLSDIVGLEEFSIRHVQGHDTTGYRLRHEQQTLIVPLMRGGEPMAFGVNDSFPLATFLHARSADDIKDHHLQGQFTVVLVDSVVNSGKSVIEFVRHIYNLHATIRIVVVAGVVQAQAISGALARELVVHPKLSIVALRLSENKFTGRGTTDTGNRLFNTTHL